MFPASTSAAEHERSTRERPSSSSTPRTRATASRCFSVTTRGRLGDAERRAPEPMPSVRTRLFAHPWYPTALLLRLPPERQKHPLTSSRIVRDPRIHSERCSP